MSYYLKETNGKQTPITPYKGFWSWEMEQRRLGLAKPVKQTQWPIGYPPKATNKNNP